MLKEDTLLFKDFKVEIKDLGTKKSELFIEVQNLVKRFPEILKHIEEDITNNSLVKKQLRIDEKNYQKDKNIDLIDLSNIPKEPIVLTLKQGRPRAICNEFLLYLIVLRGCYGSITTKEVIEIIKDSKTIEHIMHYYKCKSLASNTIRENLNMITPETLDFISKCQMQLIYEEGLDDFNKVIMDSTDVKGNTAYPTDITILDKLFKRITKNFEHLKRFGIGSAENKSPEKKLKEMSSLVTAIGLSLGSKEKKVISERKKNVKKLQRVSTKLIIFYLEKQSNLQEEWGNIDLPPNKRRTLDALWYQIEQDLAMVEYVLQYTLLLLQKKGNLPNNDKLLSISDPDVGYIQKGGRVAVIGYKPQIARSGNGFICAHLTPCGNRSDASMFTPLLEKVIENTKIVPKLVSTDDGYTSKENLSNALKLGVQTVSFSGSKGKKITEDFWDSTVCKYARNKRSAVESGMFTLKFNHKFGRLARRGIRAVTQEHYEKILAYNFMQILRAREKIKKYKLAS